MLKFRIPLRRPLPQDVLAITLVGVFVAWISMESRWAVRASAEYAARNSAIEAATTAIPAPPADLKHLELYLPKSLYTFPGMELRVCFENLVPPMLVDNLAFKVKCSVGNTSRRCWSGTFTAAQCGVHPWEITVADLAGKELAHGTCEVRVPPLESGEGKRLRLLIVGDSLTHGTWYPNRLSELFQTSGNPQLEMIGTHRPANSAPGVAHEGYNGWTWRRFVLFNSPGTLECGTPDKSPFLYRDAGCESHLDVARYLRETSPDGLPDLIIFELGINDVFESPQDEGYLFSPPRDVITPHIERLLTEFRNAAPKASLAIWLTQPVNATQGAFDASYRGVAGLDGTSRTRIALRQHWLVDHLMKRYGGREAERIYLIPMSATVDPLEDYDESNSVHPSVPGYRRIGESVYAWMKWWLAETPGPAAELAVAAPRTEKSSAPPATAAVKTSEAR